MSNEAITWAYNECSPLIKKSGALFVLVTLCNWSDQAGEAWGKQETIAARTAQGERTVREHLAWLEEQGFISKIKRRSSGGQALGDGFILDPGDRHGLLAILEKKHGDVQGHVSAWREEKRLAAQRQTNRRNLPVGSAKPTGEIRRSNRQISPVQPADFAGTYNEDTKLHQSDTGAGPASAAPPTDRPEGPVDAAAPESKPEKPPPAYTHWRNHEAEIADHLGGAWESWFRELIVLSDDGALIRLGARSKFWADHCQKLTPGLHPLLGRKLEVVFWDPEAEATARRAREADEKRKALLNEQA